MTTLALIIGALVIAAAFFGWCLARIAAQSDRDARRAHQEYLLRYTGGGLPCVRCGEPTHYSLKGRAIHPECREDAA